MLEAIAAAAAVKGGTYPNPPVGAVLVQGGEIVSVAASDPAGGAHAEVNCIGDAGGQTAGGELYVTLEPCSHHGKTAPCTDLILERRITRVIIACQDPNPLVNGKGVARLQEAGVETVTGLLEEIAATLLYRPFFHCIRTGMPYVLLKYAMTLDGKIACSNGASGRISGKEASEHVQILRKECDAVLVGAQTVRKDNPRLDCRIPGIKSRFQPRRVVVSHSGLPEENYTVFKENSHYLQAVTEDNGLEQTLCFDGSVEDLLRNLAQQGIVSLLVEGGRNIITQFILSGFFQELHAVIAPRIAGGDYSPVGDLGISNVADVLNLKGVWKPLGQDIVFIGERVDG